MDQLEKAEDEALRVLPMASRWISGLQLHVHKYYCDNKT